MQRERAGAFVAPGAAHKTAASPTAAGNVDESYNDDVDDADDDDDDDEKRDDGG